LLDTAVASAVVSLALRTKALKRVKRTCTAQGISKQHDTVEQSTVLLSICISNARQSQYYTHRKAAAHAATTAETTPTTVSNCTLPHQSRQHGSIQLFAALCYTPVTALLLLLLALLILFIVLVLAVAVTALLLIIVLYTTINSVALAAVLHYY
jgi:Flp pilus assembly protein TadB